MRYGFVVALVRLKLLRNRRPRAGVPSTEAVMRGKSGGSGGGGGGGGMLSPRIAPGLAMAPMSSSPSGKRGIGGIASRSGPAMVKRNSAGGTSPILSVLIPGPIWQRTDSPGTNGTSGVKVMV